MAQSADPSRSIAKNLNKDRSFWGYSQEQFTMVFAPAIVAMISLQVLNVENQILNYGLPVVGIFFGLVIVIRTPDHFEPTEWFMSFFNFIRSPDEILHMEFESDMGGESSTNPEAKTKSYQLSSRTQDEIYIKRIHPSSGVIELPDGDYIGGVKINPANLAKASNQKWNSMVNSFASYLNQNVEYEMQIYTRTVPFDIAEHIQEYQKRLNDKDIENRPILRNLIESRLDWYPEYLMYNGTNEREYYLIFRVNEDEVKSKFQDEEDIVEKISNFPVIGDKLSNFFDREEYTDAELKSLKINELNTRLDHGVRYCAGGLEGCSGRRLDAAEHALLIKDFWAGEISDMSMTSDDVQSLGFSYRSTGTYAEEEDEDEMEVNTAHRIMN